MWGESRDDRLNSPKSDVSASNYASNVRKIARMAPISTIFLRNRPRRPDLNFEKKLRAVLIVAVVVVIVVESDPRISGALALKIRAHSRLSPSMVYGASGLCRLHHHLSCLAARCLLDLLGVHKPPKS